MSFVFSLLSLLGAISAVFCAAIIYYGDRKALLNRIFALLCLFQSYSAFTEFMIRQSTDPASALFWLKASFLWPVIVVFLLHFSLIFTHSRFLKSDFTLMVIYGLGVLVSITFLTEMMNAQVIREPWGYVHDTAKASPILLVSQIWAGLISNISLLFVLIYYLRLPKGKERAQAGFVLLALFVPFFFVIATMVIPQILGVKAPELTSVSTAIMAVIIVYIMTKYRLFTVNTLSVADTIVATMSDALFVLDDKMNITSMNGAAHKLLGYSGEDLFGKPITSITDTTLPLSEISENRRTSALDFNMQAKSGQRVPVNISLSRIRDTNGSITGAICVARDVSERKKSEQKLKSAAAKIERSHRDLQDFLFASSHHLQEPLRKIRTLSNRLFTMYSQAGNERTIDFLQRVDRNADRMQTLMDGLRMYLSIESDATPMETFDVTDVVKQCVKDKTDDIKSIGAEIKIDQLTVIEANKGQIIILFKNLLDNSLNFKRKDAPLSISVSCRLIRETYEKESGPIVSSEGIAEFTFRDNGIGFEDKYSERIFAVFQRIPGHETEYEGAGVGLSLCRKIVERHNGSIRARGRVNEGATFIIRIPTRQLS